MRHQAQVLVCLLCVAVVSAEQVGLTSRPAAPAVDVQLDGFQHFQKEKQHPVEANKNPAPAAVAQPVVKPVTRNTVPKVANRAQAIANALHNHHQKLVESFVDPKAVAAAIEKQLAMSKQMPDLASQVRIQKEQQLLQMQQTQHEVVASAPRQAPLDEMVLEQQQQQAQQQAQHEQQQQQQQQQEQPKQQEQQQAPAAKEETPKQSLTEENVKTMTEDQLRNALLDQIHQQPQQQQQDEPDRRHYRRPPHRPRHTKSAFTLSVPTSAVPTNHIQAGEDFKATGGSPPVQPIDPNCVPVEICTGGDVVPYHDGVADLANAKKTDTPRGMCYKWCPIGCSCC